MFKSKSKLNLLTIWLLHWRLLKQLLTIISAKWFSLYYSITIRFLKLWAYKMWRLYYFLTFKFSYYSPLAKSMLETYCVWELLSFVDHASTNIRRKKKQKFLRNQENVGCISYDFVTTSEKNPFSPLIWYSYVQQQKGNKNMHFPYTWIIKIQHSKIKYKLTKNNLIFINLYMN